ncbi:MAG: hypothetical protein ABI995_13150 [Acidobacteriota bacterium]
MSPHGDTGISRYLRKPADLAEFFALGLLIKEVLGAAATRPVRNH